MCAFKTPTDRETPLKAFGLMDRLAGLLSEPLCGPGVKDLYFFTIGLHSCVSSGVPILRAFAIMAESAHHRRLQRAARCRSCCGAWPATI